MLAPVLSYFVFAQRKERFMQNLICNLIRFCGMISGRVIREKDVMCRGERKIKLIRSLIIKNHKSNIRIAYGKLIKIYGDQ